MGTKSKQYKKQYKLTNLKTGEVFEGQGWDEIQRKIGYNIHFASCKNSKIKWKVEIFEPESCWNKSQYRTEFARTNYIKRSRKGLTYKTQRNSKLSQKYGINYEQFQYLVKIGNNKCWICEQDFENESKVCVDHCHDTNLIRGCLCNNCNIGLGNFSDSILKLEKAINYLKLSPPDIPIIGKSVSTSHNERKRWRYLVKTPDGNFNSLQEAATFYNVDPTTLSRWCKIKEGFSSEKIFSNGKI